MKKAASILCLAGLFGLTAGPPVFADFIVGLADPSGWKGTGASVAITGVVTQELESDLGVSVINFRLDESGDLLATGNAKVAPYALTVGGLSYDPAATVQTRAYFKDEIYLKPTSGLLGYLEFEFEVGHYLHRFSSDGDGELGIELWYGEPGKERQLDAFMVELGGSAEDAIGIANVTLSTRGHDPNNYVYLAAARYFPFTFRVWATLDDAQIGGGVDGTSPLAASYRGVRVFEHSAAAGFVRQLTNPNDYELRSANDYDLKPIPEPASLFLLGTGLLGLGAWRKRH